VSIIWYQWIGVHYCISLGAENFNQNLFMIQNV
jgi:hypothetical protein